MGSQGSKGDGDGWWRDGRGKIVLDNKNYIMHCIYTSIYINIIKIYLIQKKI